MTNTNTTKHKHMTLEDRSEIQSCLDHGMTFKAIGKRIGKDRTTISKKVKKHLDIREGGIQLCDINGGTVTVEICPALLEAPFVCNPCKKRHARCKFCKQFYNAKKAQRAYETLRLEVREGLPLTKESFYEIDRIISEGIKRGQQLYHIIQTKNLGVSKSTVYRHLKKGYLIL